MSHDPLSIAQATLALANERDIHLNNADLQRIIYFANGMHLSKTRLPLVNGCFEAWRHGPVHPVIHNSLADVSSAPRPILSWPRWFSRPLEQKPLQITARAGRLLNRVLTHRINCNAAYFAELARAKDAPWQFVIAQAKAQKTINLRITTTIIIERFRYHKIEGVIPNEPDANIYDSPFTFEELTAKKTARLPPPRSFI